MSYLSWLFECSLDPDKGQFSLISLFEIHSWDPAEAQPAAQTGPWLSRVPKHLELVKGTLAFCFCLFSGPFTMISLSFSLSHIRES